MGRILVICGIVLAAGHGRRVGTPKALLRLKGETFHEWAGAAFREAGLDLVVVVSPQVQEALRAAGPGERRVINADPDQSGGMFASVRLGVAEAAGQGATGVILLPVDHPLVTGDDIRAVAVALRNGAAIAVAVHAGRRGHPIGLGPVAMEEIASGARVRTLRDVLRFDRSRVVEVSVSAGALEGVNTSEDLERVQTKFSVN